MGREQLSVELMGHYGGDIEHALSAWTSTRRELTEERERRIGALLHMLAEQGHHTPFEKSMLHFLVRCDIATHIQIIKHRIAVSVNAESARYRELRDDNFYVPGDIPGDIQTDMVIEMERSMRVYHAILERMVAAGVSRKRAKESSRFVRPYGSMITMDVAFNFRSLMHFVGLRTKPDAQYEIREVANLMLDLVESIPGKPFHLSLDAFGIMDKIDRRHPF